MRAFIAIELPEHVKSKVFHELEILQKKNFIKGRFVEKNNLHITLEFFGDVSTEKSDEIIKKLKEIKFKKFKCTIKKFGVFDSEKHIKIIFLEVVSDELENLQKQISEKFPAIKDFIKFNSHITIARVDSVINKEEFLKYIKNINFKNLDFEISEFVLMKSELMREGPKYKILEKFKFV